MDSRIENRDMGSSMSKVTDQRSSAMAQDSKTAANKNNKEGLGQILECESSSPTPTIQSNTF